MASEENICVKCPRCTKVCKASKGWQTWEGWGISDAIKDCAESLSSHMQMKHDIDEDTANRVACGHAKQKYPNWLVPPFGQQRAPPGPLHYEPEPPPPPPSGPPPATSSPPPLAPAQEEEEEEEEEDEEDEEDLDGENARRRLAPWRDTQETARTPGGLGPAPAAAATGGLTVSLPDLATATNDDLVATADILTEHLQRVYREMHQRIQTGSHAPPPAGIRAWSKAD